MAEKDRENTKQSENQAPQQTSDVPGAGWRPGRNPANREINLGLRRSQRLRGRVEPSSSQAASRTEDLTPEIPPGQGDQFRDQQPAATSSANMPTQTSDTREAPKRIRRPIPPDWKPPLAIGESLGDNLSRMEEAERSVLQWEAIVENARITQPRADLSGLERQLETVKRKFEQMEETDENLIPVNELETTKRQRIQKRISLLSASLERNECPVGDVNIRAAIQAYQTGRIKCWDKWTLIYAGNVVDFCPSYESFTIDRDERMDRYYDMHGEGWLWYEAPLAPKGNYQPGQLKAATWAQPSRETSALTEYHTHAWHIHMGFRRVKGFHARPAPVRLNAPGDIKNGKVLQYKTELREHNSKKTKTCYVEDEDDGDGDDDSAAPRVCFKMQLDSGATHPSLHNTDLKYLGIDPETYPAQTYADIKTASEVVTARIYEIRVDVCRHNGKSLVGDKPVYPNERRQLGGIVAVMILVDSAEDQSEPLGEWYKEALKNDEDVSETAMARRDEGSKESRLSGMLPFQVCYFAGAPGASTFWFGEDRRDVLGADRMPGQQRWERHKKAQGIKRPDELANVDRPTVAFRHQSEGIEIRDVDSNADTGTSVLTINDRKGTRQVILKAGEEVGKVIVKEGPKKRTHKSSVATLESRSPKKRKTRH